MNFTRHLIASALLASLTACEMPRPQSSPPVQLPPASDEATAKAIEEARKEAEAARAEAQNARSEAEAARQELEQALRNKATATVQPPQQPTSPSATAGGVNRQKRVDGRVAVPSSDTDAPRKLSSVLYYSFGEAPRSFRPQPGTLVFEPVAAPLSVPAKRPETSVDQILLEAGDLRWEASLIEKGITLLDRSMLQRMNQEHFLQNAPGADGTLPPKESAPWTYLPPNPGSETNKSPLPWADLGEWQRVHQALLPRLRGHQVEEARRITQGKLLPAKWILEIGPMSIEASQATAVGMRPAAEWVDFEPAIASEAVLPTLADGVWKSSKDDPFVFEHESGTIFFDPDSGSLWTFEKAWLGMPVKRADYIARRTKVTEVKCADCERSEPSKSNVSAPSPESTPTHWFCAVCESRYEVTYFDGYKHPDLPSSNAHAVIRWRFVTPRPGIYPVLRPGTGAARELRLSSADPRETASSLLRQSGPKALREAGTDNWCVVERSLEGLIITAAELAALRAGLAPKYASAASIPVPVVESDGRQLFRRTADGHVPVSANVPAETASVSARLVNAQDSSVALSGTLTLSFLNTLEAPVVLPVGPTGPDLSGWPSEAERRTRIEAALLRTLAQLVAN